MCITFFCIEPKTKPEIKLMFCFNREELTQRKTLKFHQFEDDSNIYAGKDILSGGSWLGFNIKTGLLVILTNYVMQFPRVAKSRGHLVKYFLSSELVSFQQQQKVDQIIYKHMKQISQKSQQYSPFNLTVINMRTGYATYICSQTPENPPKNLTKHEVHAICNSHIDTLWPKTKQGINLFQNIVSQIAQMNQQSILSSMHIVLKDKTKFIEDDRKQSAIFVQPYWSIRQNAQSRTKTSFMLLVVENQGKLQIGCKEVTYSGAHSENEEEINLRVQI